MEEKYWHKIFELTLVVKWFNGMWETASGLIILLVSRATISTWFDFLSHRELLEDPNDKFIHFISNLLSNVSSSTQMFIAIYILVHGFLNIFLSIQLYRERHWAYLVTISATLIFMIYQVYRISLYHSVFLSIVTVFDVFFVLLAWHEYKYHRDLKAIRI